MGMEVLQSVVLKLSRLEENKGQLEGLPGNPRSINRGALDKLVKSIGDHPEMMSLREILVYPHGDKFLVIGGNMRLKALKRLKYKEAPCKVIPEDTPIEALRAYVIKDNGSFGDWDFDMLRSEWDLDLLVDCMIDVPDVEVNDDEASVGSNAVSDDDDDYIKMMNEDRLFSSDNSYDIPCLLASGCPQNGLLLPVSAWGSDKRDKKGINTYHFYVDDYRFEALWKDPTKLLVSGCQMVVEPNLSLFDTTPIAFGLHQIYKKRWIARWWQENGIKVFADLNVARKFQEYNIMGIPEGYNAFATRGYNERLEYLKEEIAIAKRISGKEVPNMLVYGGGKNVKEICKENGIIYIEQFMKNKEGK